MFLRNVMPPFSGSLPTTVCSVTFKNTVLTLYNIYFTSITFSVSGRFIIFTFGVLYRTVIACNDLRNLICAASIVFIPLKHIQT